MEQNHNNNHIKEKEQFKKLFKQEHIDNFEERFKVFEVFLQTERHVTVSELLELLNENGYQLESSFVRDTLKLMCSFGFAKKIQFENGPVRYEHKHLGKHHDHIICTKCRKIVEFEEKYPMPLLIGEFSANTTYFLVSDSTHEFRFHLLKLTWEEE